MMTASPAAENHRPRTWKIWCDSIAHALIPPDGNRARLSRESILTENQKKYEQRETYREQEKTYSNSSRNGDFGPGVLVPMRNDLSSISQDIRYYFVVIQTNAHALQQSSRSPNANLESFILNPKSNKESDSGSPRRFRKSADMSERFLFTRNREDGYSVKLEDCRSR